ncbi:MAG: putative cytoplasmic protein [Daejeonella sp.]|nr:putative cytoplasmic protein [Daejeonella sp.]
MVKKNVPETRVEVLYNGVRQIIEDARNSVYRTANVMMVKAYWNIGKLMVEEEQKGEHRAGYGTELIRKMSERLSATYGKGYTETNIKYMRQFYKAFEKSHAVRDELSWTHYRLLLKAEREEARVFYMQEAIESNWSTRTLERQINSHYYERMVMTRTEGRPLVKAEQKARKKKCMPAILLKTLTYWSSLT